MLQPVVEVRKRALTLKERGVAKGPELAQQGHKVHPAQSLVSFFFQTSSILSNFERGFDVGLIFFGCFGGEPSVRVVFGFGGGGGQTRPDSRRTPCWTVDDAVPLSSSWVQEDEPWPRAQASCQSIA